MHETWTRAWAEIDARRRRLGWSLIGLYNSSGVSETTFRKMAAGQPLVSVAKRAAIAQALGWTPDSFDLIEAGERPQTLDERLRTLAATRAEIERADPIKDSDLEALGHLDREIRDVEILLRGGILPGPGSGGAIHDEIKMLRDEVERLARVVARHGAQLDALTGDDVQPGPAQRAGRA